MASDLAAQLAATAELIEKRESMNDEVETPRSVDHLILVKPGRAGALVRDLEASGFRVYNRRRRPLRVAVEFDRDDAVDQDSGAAFTRQVVAIAERHGAAYDGWGALILPRDRKPYEPPVDVVAAAEVDVPREQVTLRSAYAAHLIAGGCPEALAVERAQSLKLDVGDGAWLLKAGRGSVWSRGDFSPSEALERTRDLAQQVVGENARRRKPWWSPGAG